MKNHRTERKRLRLSGYDYSSDGYYFVTICTQNRECFFGNVINGTLGLNDIGYIVAQCWQDIPNHFCDVRLYEWVVMPNHFHGIVVLEQQFNRDTFIVGIRKTVTSVGDADLRPLHLQIHQNNRHDRSKMLLPKIIHGFKSSVTRIINKANINTNFQWQRSYYDHIIRNDKSLDNICNYIQNNPFEWGLDVENTINHFSESDIKKHYDSLFI